MMFYSLFIAGLLFFTTLWTLLPHTLILFLIVTLGILFTIYVHLEPFFLSITKQQIPFGLNEPLTIAFISDLQMGKHKKSWWLQRVVKKIITLQPDLVILGGDFIANEDLSTDSELSGLKEFKKLTDHLPVYAILGNHEYGLDYRLKNNVVIKRFPDRSEKVAEILQSTGVRLLRNELTTIEARGQHWSLYGTDDSWARNVSWNGLKVWDRNTPLLVATHNADALLSYPQEAPKPNLVVSGHTHGGQIRLPFIGPLGNAQTSLENHLYQGFHFWRNFPLFVSRGLGESNFAIRFLAPPEIAMISLEPVHNKNSG